MNCNLFVGSQYPFTVTITNIVKPFNQNEITNGSSNNIPWSGDMTMNVPGMGEVAILDVSGNQSVRKDVAPYSAENIMLVRYQGLEACYLFDGNGQIQLDFDEIGDLHVSLVEGNDDNILLEPTGKDLIVKTQIPSAYLPAPPSE